jgi:hypothetical protein
MRTSRQTSHSQRLLAWKQTMISLPHDTSETYTDIVLSDFEKSLREYIDDEVKTRLETDVEIQQLETDLQNIYEEIHATFQQHNIIDTDDNYGYAKNNQKNYTDLINANKNAEGIKHLSDKFQEHLKCCKTRRRDIPIAMRKKIKEELVKTHKEGMKSDLQSGPRHQHHDLSDLEIGDQDELLMEADEDITDSLATRADGEPEQLRDIAAMYFAPRGWRLSHLSCATLVIAIMPWSTTRR